MKSYTDIEQSKKLAEFLPLKSADMTLVTDLGGEHLIGIPYIKEHEDLEELHKQFGEIESQEFPCWSLAALLEQLDDEITDEDGNDYHLTIVKESLQYQLYYHDSWGQVEDIETNYYDDLIDACYEMILKLHELKML